MQKLSFEIIEKGRKKDQKANNKQKHFPLICVVCQVRLCDDAAKMGKQHLKKEDRKEWRNWQT